MEELVGPKKGQDVVRGTLLGLLTSLYPNASCQLDVCGHDGDVFSLDGTEVGVFKKSDKIGFRGLLECHQGCQLEPDIMFEFLSYFSDQSLERQLPYQ